MQYGDAYDYTVMVETVQELQTPSIVLKNQEDFQKTHKVLHSYLTTIAVVQHSMSKLLVLDKLFDDRMIKVANKVHMYFGVYDGQIRPADQEAKGVLRYTLEDLEIELKKFPHTFTGDMHMFFREYKKEIKKFVEWICLDHRTKK